MADWLIWESATIDGHVVTLLRARVVNVPNSVKALRVAHKALEIGPNSNRVLVPQSVASYRCEVEETALGPLATHCATCNTPWPTNGASGAFLHQDPKLPKGQRIMTAVEGGGLRCAKCGRPRIIPGEKGFPT